MEGMCLDHFVTEDMLRSFEGILGKNGHTYMPMSEWKVEATSILEKAAKACDFKTPCYFCAFRDTPACNEYRKTFIQGIVPRWFQEQMDQDKTTICYWDPEKSHLQVFPTFEEAISSGKEIWVADSSAVRAEAAIAHRVRVSTSSRQLNNTCLEQVLKWSQIDEKFKLTEDQLDVVRAVLEQNFVVVDGGPGTGKTTILKIIYQYYCQLFPDHVYCCAPTGKAAKRMSDLTRSPASTIHRLLGATYDEETEQSFFTYTEENRHPGKVFLIDEASMIDSVIFASFLAAVNDDAIIILVGDSHQLPSVGAGRVLADLIGSNKVCVCTLVENFRQLHDSMIVKNASLILHGEEMVFPEEESDIHLIEAGPQEIPQKIEEWIREQNPDYFADKWKDLAILCPKKNGPISTNVINEQLQKESCRRRGTTPLPLRGGGDGKARFARNDRVIQVRNDYRLICTNSDGSEGYGIFNGDIGYIKSIIPFSDFPMEILFDDGRKVNYPAESAGDVELAYALTVHKAQGGEWKKVLLVLPPERSPIFNRNLLYTAVTRAKEELWIIGDRETISRMIRSRYADNRKTALKVFLRSL
ncbi:MAG: AAA family ATPase [Clostridiales bacterium]|nr:AAA family ATPase [Clostridiales bacterium]